MSLELQQLEDDTPPCRCFRPTAALVAGHVDAYPPEVQDASPACSAGAQPRRNGDETSCAPCSLPIRALARAGPQGQGRRGGLLACRGYHQQLLGNMDGRQQDYGSPQTWRAGWG